MEERKQVAHNDALSHHSTEMDCERRDDLFLFFSLFSVSARLAPFLVILRQFNGHVRKNEMLLLPLFSLIVFTNENSSSFLVCAY